MALYEMILALHMDDDPLPSLKEGDMSGVYSYPKDHGFEALNRYLIVIVRTSASLKKIEKMCYEWVCKSIKTSKLLSMDYVDMLGIESSHNYCVAFKKRYSISFDTLIPKISGIDLGKARDSKKKYQPCKKTSQIVNYFDGRPGYHLLTSKDIETSTSGIDKEQEIIIDLDLTPIIYDKLAKEMVNP